MKTTQNKYKIRSRYLYRSLIPLLFLLAAFFLGNTWPFHTWYELTPAATLSELENLSRSRTPYVEFEADTLWYTGYNYISGGQTKGVCYYTILDDQCVFLILQNSDPIPAETLTQTRVTGTLIRDTATTSAIVSGMAEDLDWTSAELSQMSSALLIDATAVNRMFYNICYLVTRLFLALAVLTLVKNLFYIIFPGKSRFLQPQDRRPDHIS